MTVVRGTSYKSESTFLFCKNKRDALQGQPGLFTLDGIMDEIIAYLREWLILI